MLFRKLIDFIRRVVGQIIPIKNVEDGLKDLDVNIDISDTMINSLELWAKMYEDKAPWLTDTIYSMNLSASIAMEIARLVTIEMESEITGLKNPEGKIIPNSKAEYLNEQYQVVVDKLRVQTEYAVAKGGLIFKPYIDRDKIAVDFVQADDFYPVKFNASGDLIGVIFPDIIVKGKNIYTRLEYHLLMNNGNYYISNTSFLKQEGVEGLGVPVPLTDLEEWKELETEVNLIGVDMPLFAYFKMPLANHKDSRSQLGVSVYGKAENLIQEADKQWSKILWEYAGTELAVDASVDMMSGSNLPSGSERLFRRLDTEDENFYQVFSPEIRDSSLFNGLNKILQRVEFNCGLAYGTLSDIQVVEKTAEEIKTSKQRSYSTIVDMQKSLQNSLEHLVEVMDYLSGLYSLATDGEYEVSYSFDDSIVIDAKAEQAIVMQEVASGLVKPEFYLMMRYGVTEIQAKEMLPKVVEETTEDDEDDLE